MLQVGATHSRPPRGKAQAHPGVHPLSAYADKKFEPLPDPLGLPPYHYDLEEVFPEIAAATSEIGRLIFHTVGDTGGIKNSDYQSAVAARMKGDLNLPKKNRPQFFMHLGDVVYYNGEVGDYYDQFYMPYEHYNVPIISIPGNHDGDPKTSAQQSLDGWVRYFMTPQPHIDPVSGDAPRVTLSLPNVYYTLDCPFATMVCLYTNVPEGGSVDSVQQQWCTNEFKTAPEDKALIVVLHHPVYSFDDHHSGSAAMADVLDRAINDSRRVPNIVLTAHVHNYQRIEKNILDHTPTPFLVAGHGGYYHLHGMTADVGHVDKELGARLEFHDQYHHGYVTVTVDAEHVSIEMTPIAETGGHKHQKDAKPDNHSYAAKLLQLPKGVTITL